MYPTLLAAAAIPPGGGLPWSSLEQDKGCVEECTVRYRSEVRRAADTMRSNINFTRTLRQVWREDIALADCLLGTGDWCRLGMLDSQDHGVTGSGDHSGPLSVAN